MTTTVDKYSAVTVPFKINGAHTSNSSLSTVVTLTPPSGATQLLIQALTQNVRMTLDGTTPTASLGFQLKAGNAPLVVTIGIGTVIKLIEETATANIQYQWGY